MRLRTKLSIRSTFIFACTLGCILLSTYFLFRKFTRELYEKKLLEHARIAAHFYFEKDEVTARQYREIEKRYKEISRGPVRIYDASSKQLIKDDSLPFRLPDDVLNKIISTGSTSLKIGDHQVVGIFYRDNEGDFIVVASGSDNKDRAQVSALGWMLAGLFVIGIPVHYFLMSLLSRQTFRPFGSLIRKVNSITAENLHSRLEVPEGRSDEMKELITTFNYFLERLEHGIQTQRNFLKNASHELRTPLAAIIGNLEVTLNHPRENAEYLQLLWNLKNDALHLRSIVEGLLTLSGLEIEGNQQMAPVRIDEILWNLIEKKKIEYPPVQIAVNFSSNADLEQLLTVHGNKDLLFVALSNIVDNAIKFSLPHPVNIEAEAKGGQLVLTISDKGPGIAPEDQEAIFELFHRCNRTRHIAGYGIGLYLTRQILHLHKVSIKISSGSQAGTSVSLVFPQTAR